MDLRELDYKIWINCREDISSQLGTRGLQRVERMLDCAIEGNYEKPNHHLQPESRLFFPDLKSVPWHDPDSFSWRSKIESKLSLIKKELMQVLRNGVGQAYLDQFNTQSDESPENTDCEINSGWEAYFLKRHGNWLEPNIGNCPTTRWILEYCKAGPCEILFSGLKPGSATPLHSGPTNLLLTCHLPLIVNSNCAIRVADETRNWTEGKLVVFDDSFLHVAWNQSSRPRYVLLFEVWHPSLTKIERLALKLV